MPIQIRCSNPACAKVLSVKDELAGKAVKCPACQTTMRVPGGARAAAPSKPASSAPRATAAPPKTSNPAPKAAASPPRAASPAPKAGTPAPKAVTPAPKAVTPAPKVGKGPPPAPKKAAPAPASARPPSKRDRNETDDLDEAPAGSLWNDCALLKHSRFMTKVKFSIWGAKFVITDPDTKETIGIAREKFSWLFAFLKSQKMLKAWLPMTIEVRETDDAPVIFRLYKPMSLFKFICTVEIHDDRNVKIGYFRTKIFSFLGGFWVYDAEDQQVAEVQGKITFFKDIPKLRLLAEDGRELGYVTSEALEAVRERKAKLIWGIPGITVTMSDDVKNDLNTKVLLLGTTLAMEMTGVGKMLVSK